VELYPVIHCLLGKRQPGRSIETHTSVRPHPRLPFRLSAEDPIPVLAAPVADASLPFMHTHSKHPVPASRRPLARWPLLLVVLVASHALVAGCGGSSQPAGDAGAPPESSTPVAEAPAPTSETHAAEPAEAAELGAKVYSTRCALCHGAKGNGDGPAAAGLNPKPRAHTDKAYMSTLTDDQIVAVIRNGKGTMPAWGKILSEEEVQAVAKHVRELGQ